MDRTTKKILIYGHFLLFYSKSLMELVANVILNFSM